MGNEETNGTYLEYVFAAVDNPKLRPGAIIRAQMAAEELRDRDAKDGLNRARGFMQVLREELKARRAVV